MKLGAVVCGIPLCSMATTYFFSFQIFKFNKPLTTLQCRPSLLPQMWRSQTLHGPWKYRNLTGGREGLEVLHQMDLMTVISGLVKKEKWEIWNYVYCSNFH